MSSITSWNFPTSIKIGSGSLNQISGICKDLKILKPLIVTDKNLQNNGIMQDLKNKLVNSSIPLNIFSKVDPNPTEKNLNDGLKILKNGGFDGIIAFGGGSALDLGKLLGFMVAQKLPVWEFEDLGDNWKKANANNILPIIAIPTTAGTGQRSPRTSNNIKNQFYAVHGRGMSI